MTPTPEQIERARVVAMREFVVHALAQALADERERALEDAARAIEQAGVPDILRKLSDPIHPAAVASILDEWELLIAKAIRALKGGS